MKKYLLLFFTVSTLVLSAQIPPITETKFPVGPLYNSTAVGDINDDGNIDVVIARTTGQIEIYYGTGNISFPNVQNFTVGSTSNLRSPEIIDWDGDGDLDIIVADAANNNGSGVYLISNDGPDPNNTNNILTSIAQILTNLRVLDIAVGNFSGTNSPDIAFTTEVGVSSVSDSFFIYESTGGNTPSTLTNTFSRFSIGDSVNLKMDDTDGDGDLDITFSDLQNGRIYRFKNDGSSTPVETGFNLLSPRESAFADLNGDGIPEHIYINSDFVSELYYRVTDANGSLSAATTISSLNPFSQGFGVAASDFDNDGLIDIVVTDFASGNANTNPVKYFENTGTTTLPVFVERSLPFTGDKTKVRKIKVADFDNDGIGDFLVEDVNASSGSFIIYNFSFNPTTVFVDENATGANDGSSWADAFTTLQDADASVAPNDNVWVAAGTYKPVDKTSGIVFSNKVNLYGGFNGTETALNQRDIANNPTILSGDINGNDPTTIGNVGINSSARSDNANTILRLNDGGLVDGFTLIGGQGDITTDATRDRGSALYLGRTADELVVRNSKFYNNVNRIHGAISAQFDNSGNNNIFKVENCEFAGNVSPFGSAFTVIKGGNEGTLTADITNSLFYNNETNNVSGTNAFGSTLYFLSVNANRNQILNTKINNCTITDNIENSNDASVITLAPIAVRRTGSGHVLNVDINNSIITRNINNSSKPFRTLTQLNGNDRVNSVDIINSKIDEDGSGPNGFSFDFSHIVTASNFTGTNILGNATNVAFNDFANNDYSLNATDIDLIDAGDNTKIPMGITADLANNQRIANSVVDMGAYEFNSSPALSISDSIFTEQNVVVYPNPTIDKLYIKTNVNIKSFKVISVLGKEIVSGKNPSSVDVSQLKVGVYFIKINTDKGSITKRFIKQ